MLQDLARGVSREADPAGLRDWGDAKSEGRIAPKEP